MAKAHTYDDVKSFIEKEGFLLISTTYKNALTKIDILCEKGHEFSMRFNDFKNGHRCKYCARKAKYSLDQVKKVVSARGYTLLPTEYRNSHSFLNLICPKGHYCKIKFYAFNGKRQDGCNECAKVKRADSNRYTFEQVTEIVKSAGYTLNSNSYTSSDYKLDIICDRGHSFKMNLKSFNRGQRCPKCKSSRGECTIRYILHSTIGKENIKEQYPITIKGKKHIFDFCIPSNPNIYIEYDGEQHFNKDNRWYSEDREKRDTEKNNFVHEEGAILIRIPYYLSKEEVYKSLTTNLTPHLKIKKTEIDLSRAEYYNGFSFSVNDVAEYYITHNCRSTANKFNIYELTVRNYFKEVFGMTKTDYINKKYDTDYSPAKIGILPQFNQQ